MCFQGHLKIKKKKKNDHLRKWIVPEIFLFNSYNAFISANWKIFRHYWTLEKGRRAGVSKSNQISHFTWHKGTLHVIVLLNVHDKLKQIIFTIYESCPTKSIYYLLLNNTFLCVFLSFISVSKKLNVGSSIEEGGWRLWGVNLIEMLKAWWDRNGHEAVILESGKGTF